MREVENQGPSLRVMADQVTRPPGKASTQKTNTQTIIKVDMSPNDKIPKKQGLEEGDEDLLGD